MTGEKAYCVGDLVPSYYCGSCYHECNGIGHCQYLCTKVSSKYKHKHYCRYHIRKCPNYSKKRKLSESKRRQIRRLKEKRRRN